MTRLSRGSLKNFDVKKLRGRDDVFRARKGNLRIIFRKNKDGEIYILALERRSETTYNF